MARRDTEQENDLQSLSENIREAKIILKKAELRTEDLDAAIEALEKAKEITQKHRKR